MAEGEPSCTHAHVHNFIFHTALSAARHAQVDGRGGGWGRSCGTPPKAWRRQWTFYLDQQASDIAWLKRFKVRLHLDQQALDLDSMTKEILNQMQKKPPKKIIQQQFMANKGQTSRTQCAAWLLCCTILTSVNIHQSHQTMQMMHCTAHQQNIIITIIKKICMAPQLPEQSFTITLSRNRSTPTPLTVVTEMAVKKTV